MPTELTLAAAIAQAGIVEDDVEAPLTIFAKRINGEWRPESPAVVLSNSSDGPAEDILPSEYRQFEYFLELSVVEEVVQGRLEQTGQRELTEDDLSRVVVYYAEHDTWPAL